MEQSLMELNEKIDLLTAQVDSLSALAQVNERQRQQRAELMRDLTPIVNQAFHMSIEQLEEVQEYIDLSDLFHFVKRLLRNGRNFEKMLDQLESMMDLIDTMGPLSNEAFGKAIDVMAEMEHKGYFTLAQQGTQIVDQVVSSLNGDDVRNLGDTVTLMVDMLKEVSKPENINWARETIVVAKQEMEKPINNSLSGLMRQMGDPEVRRGLALTLRILKVLGSQANSEKAN